MAKLYNNVYTVDEENSHRFYQMPKELFINPKYKCLNSDAKVLYSLLLDRKELSRSNNWVDENKQVYLIYTRENLSEEIGVSRPTITKAFKQLINAGLIIEERMGLNKPNRIYVCRIEYSSDNGRKRSLHQEENILSPNDTDISETEKIKRYTITHNGDRLLNFYNECYKDKFGKEHPTVRMDQLEDMEYHMHNAMSDMDIPEEDMMNTIEEYFEELPPKNDGKIFGFLKYDGMNYGILCRYLL